MVFVASPWFLGEAVARLPQKTTAKIGSNKKRETVLLGLYAGLVSDVLGCADRRRVCCVIHAE